MPEEPFDLYEAIRKHRDAQRYLDLMWRNRLARVGPSPRMGKPGRVILWVRVSQEMVDEVDKLVREGKALNRSQAVEDAFWLILDKGMVDELTQRAKEQLDERKQIARAKALESDPMLKWLVEGLEQVRAEKEVDERE